MNGGMPEKVVGGFRNTRMGDPPGTMLGDTLMMYARGYYVSAADTTYPMAETLLSWKAA